MWGKSRLIIRCRILADPNFPPNKVAPEKSEIKMKSEPWLKNLAREHIVAFYCTTAVYPRSHHFLINIPGRAWGRGSEGGVFY